MKNSLYVLLFLLCASNIDAISSVSNTNLQQKTLLQNFAQAIIPNHDDASKKLTAIALGMQCANAAPVYVYSGTDSFQNPTPIGSDSLFQIGSITKSFITVVVLQLVKEHQLKLDDPKFMQRWFPEYPKWQGITLRQLLTMTSGIPGNGTAKADDIYRHLSAAQYHGFIAPKTILDLTYHLPLDFIPGSQYEYSNTNYTVLGIFIEKITGHTVQEEVQQRIFEPLHLQHTYFPANKLAQIPAVDKADIVHGYDFYDPDSDPYPFQKYGQDITDFSVSYLNYAGAIASTIADINTFAHALYHRGKLLDAEQIQTLTTLVSTKTGQSFSPLQNPGTMGYGLGIFGFYSPMEKTMVYFYQGETDGFSVSYLYIPQTQLYLLVAVNTSASVVNKQNVMALLHESNQLCRH